MEPAESEAKARLEDLLRAIGHRPVTFGLGPDRTAVGPDGSPQPTTAEWTGDVRPLRAASLRPGGEVL